jgi:hypothetical protein
MDILKMLAELRAEQQQIDEAILAIERLATGVGGKRRGRPPKWMAALSDATEPAAPGKKRTVSAAGRKRMAAAQKKRWAEKKAQASEAGAKS